MSEIICEFCNTKFSSKYTLKNHQKTTKFCLEIQKNENALYCCEFCGKESTRLDYHRKHIEKCKEKKLISESKLHDELIEYKSIIDELKQQINDKDNSIKTYIEKIELYKELYQEEKIKNIKLEDDIKLLASRAIENTGSKTTTINNKNQIYNSLQPLTEEYMKEQTKFLTYNNVKNGAHGIAHFASNHTFKDRLICSDKSRLNFVFKNEADLIIKDPEGIEITKKFIEINREEIVRLVNEYISYVTDELMKESTSGDMYKFWAKKREEFLAIRSAVNKGNVSDNKESYTEFKNFLLALSDLVPR